MTKTFRALCSALILLFGVVAAQGQLSTATALGTVTDSTGAAIPNATVVLTQTQTNFMRTTVTDVHGEYHAEFLPVGPYMAKVNAAGFKESVQNGIVLTVTQQATLNFKLDIGSESTVVEVSGQVPLVDMADSVLGRTVDNREIDNLPLVNRDTYQLLNLTPGVQNVQQENSIGVPMEHVIINGSSDNLVGQVTYYLDGGINMTGVRATGNVVPNPDAVDQFVVDTNNFSAQYGRTGAGVVSVITKSGTNQVHGSIFYFNQETNFDATSYPQTTKTQLHRNRFGATLGGPVKRDKMFFFGSYAGLREIVPAPAFNTVVPDALQRVGNFSENFPTTTPAAGAGACATTLNAADKANANYGGKFFVCDPVTHTIVPNNRLDLDPNFVPDVVATNILKIVPMPNTTNMSNRWTATESLPNQTDEFLIKGDFQTFAKHRIELTYFQSNGNQQNLPSGANLPGYLWAISDYVYRQQNANASDVWTISPRSVNQVWATYSRMIAGRVSTPGQSLDAFGSNINVQGTPSLAQVSVTGFFTLAQAISGPLTGDNIYGLRDVYSITLGKHSINAGGEGYLEHDRNESLLNNYGVFAFANSTVPNTLAGQTGFVKTGAAIADFLIGHPNTMSQDSPDDANEGYFNYGFFVQDDWRVIPNLTLNLGIRYDVQTAPTDTQRRIAVFSPGVQSTVSPTAIQGQLFPGDPGVPDGGTATNYNHVSPRIGFAFDPYHNGRTVFHGGAGLFFDTVSGNEWTLSQNFQPFAVRETNAFTHVVSLSNIYATDCQDFAGCVSPFPFVYSKSNPRYVSPSSLTFIQQNMRWPYNIQANFGLQQQFGNTLAVSINYVGALSRKVPLAIDHNAPIYNTANPASNTTGDVNCRRPYLALPFAAGSTTTCASPAVGAKYYSNAYVIEDGQTTDYNGLQVIVTKRLSQHISFNGFYIWAKAFASASLQTTGNIGNSAATEPEDYFNLKLERQRTDNDIREQMVTSFVWKPDYFDHFNRVARTILNGWSIAGIVSLRSGKPFNITTGTDDNFDGDTNDRPNLLPGQIATPIPYKRSAANYINQKWFNTAAYCKNGAAGCPAGAGPSGLDGTVRDNTLDAPGLRNVDASIFRDFAIYSRVRFQFRGEAQNVFNLTNLSAPGGTLGTTASFGVISGSPTTGTLGSNRVIQVGGRILF